MVQGPDQAGRATVAALRQAIRRIEARAPALTPSEAVLPLGGTLDAALGGGLACGALHEIAAPRETEIAAATGFALALAARPARRPAVLWIALDMSLVESGAPYGPGLDEIGLAPERLVTVAAAGSRDVLWAMEEGLACRAVGLVIGEIRGGRGLDAVAARRLSLAAARHGALAVLLRAAPGTEPSAAATRWIVGAAPSAPTAIGLGAARLAVTLVRNRRGHVGTWIMEWNRVDRCFIPASAPRQPVAEAASDRPDRAARAGQ